MALEGLYVVLMGGVVWDGDDFGVAWVGRFTAGAREDGEFEGGVFGEVVGDVVADVCAAGADDEDFVELIGWHGGRLVEFVFLQAESGV